MAAYTLPKPAGWTSMVSANRVNALNTARKRALAMSASLQRSHLLDASKLRPA